MLRVAPSAIEGRGPPGPRPQPGTRFAHSGADPMKSLGSSTLDVRSATVAVPGSQSATPEPVASSPAVLEFSHAKRADRARPHRGLEAIGTLGGGMAHD